MEIKYYFPEIIFLSDLGCKDSFQYYGSTYHLQLSMIITAWALRSLRLKQFHLYNTYVIISNLKTGFVFVFI